MPGINEGRNCYQCIIHSQRHAKVFMPRSTWRVVTYLVDKWRASKRDIGNGKITGAIFQRKTRLHGPRYETMASTDRREQETSCTAVIRLNRTPASELLNNRMDWNTTAAIGLLIGKSLQTGRLQTAKSSTNHEMFP